IAKPKEGRRSTHEEPGHSYHRLDRRERPTARDGSSVTSVGSEPERQLPAGLSSSLSIGLSAVLMLRTRNTWSRAAASSRDRSNISPARERELSWATSTRGR